MPNCACLHQVQHATAYWTVTIAVWRSLLYFLICWVFFGSLLIFCLPNNLSFAIRKVCLYSLYVSQSVSLYVSLFVHSSLLPWLAGLFSCLSVASSFICNLCILTANLQLYLYVCLYLHICLCVFVCLYVCIYLHYPNFRPMC